MNSVSKDVESVLSRRNFILTSSIGVAGLTLKAVPANAQFGSTARTLIGFIIKNYPQVWDYSEAQMTSLGRRIGGTVGAQLASAAAPLVQHFVSEWAVGSEDLAGALESSEVEEARSHTTKCPYCLTLARAVEQQVPELDAVPNRLPTRFSIAGGQYIADPNGVLLDAYNGSRAGSIYFDRGQYVAVNLRGIQFAAFPIDG